VTDNADEIASTSTAHLTATIVAAYASQQPIGDAGALMRLMDSVHRKISDLAAAKHGEPIGTIATIAEKAPAVPIEESVTNDYIICLEDGKKFKSLKRHLRFSYGLSPDAYRKKWGLPPDYPMTAPSYTKLRSQMALEAGLGRRG
jgi:predicted transcriptional regulator